MQIWIWYCLWQQLMVSVFKLSFLKAILGVCLTWTDSTKNTVAPQQHNQDLREIYKLVRILEFITFYHNALHLTRVHCAPFYQNALRQGRRWERASFASQTQSFLCGKFSTARWEVLTNLRHAVVFQISTMVNLGIGFQFKSLWLVQALDLTRRWAFALRTRNTGNIQIPAC